MDEIQAVQDLFLYSARARMRDELIHRVGRDKEFHFQNWIGDRLSEANIPVDDAKRNSYPDFTVVTSPVGFEVKGLETPGRVTSYDSNSQLPAGTHNQRTIYYTFGRYPQATAGEEFYPLMDLAIVHGDFLNAQPDYQHKNKSFRGFGSYGDILVRDRKMYVVPTPFSLVEGLGGHATLIVPGGSAITSSELAHIATLERVEVAELTASYCFDLDTNELTTITKPNPTAGRKHTFDVYRLVGNGDDKSVEMKA